jgi:hypothetical protein
MSKSADEEDQNQEDQNQEESNDSNHIRQQKMKHVSNAARQILPSS